MFMSYFLFDKSFLSPVISSRSFIVLPFTLISIIPLELVFDAPDSRHVKCEKQYVPKLLTEVLGAASLKCGVVGSTSAHSLPS